MSMWLLLQARPLISQVAEGGSLQALMDPRLGSDYDPSIMMRMVECAAAAVRHSAQQRPSMVQVRSVTTRSNTGVLQKSDRMLPRRSSNTCKGKHERMIRMAFSKLQP
jgi:hypothetical protein